jgi:hypothetical protein
VDRLEGMEHKNISEWSVATKASKEDRAKPIGDKIKCTSRLAIAEFSHVFHF